MTATETAPNQSLVDLARRLFPHWESLPTLQQLEERYPARQLGADAWVTRVAPSPTGFAHIGFIYASLLNRLFALQSGGVFILRIEDTDSKREVEGAAATLLDGLRSFGLQPDEGVIGETATGYEEKGSYGPYHQSARKEIYQALAYHLVAIGRAYPCFCSDEELTAMAEMQQAQKARTGYYGHWAKWRHASIDEVNRELDQGSSFVIRLRTPSAGGERLRIKDNIKGLLVLPQNDLDAVILKSDLQSLYHFAHAIDDHYMGITHVVRGDEWVSSLPLHLQIFEAFGWRAPEYGHLAPIQKLEMAEQLDEESGQMVMRESRRKLSKRKDPEADVRYYRQRGYAAQAVVEYLLNIANSDFEDWRRKSPAAPLLEFKLRINKQNVSGAVVDEQKLANISKDVISRLEMDALFDEGHAWAVQHDPQLAGLMSEDSGYTKNALGVERDGSKKAKRIGTWADLRGQLWCFFDGLYDEVKELPFPEKVQITDRIEILKRYPQFIELNQGSDGWFQRVRALAQELGFATDMKAFKANPEKFKGSVGDVAMVLRVAICGSQQTPDLYEVMKVLGLERVLRRLAQAAAKS